MTVDFRIGNAEIEIWEDTYELTVARLVLNEAPEFLNDSLTGKQNFRSMANRAYSEFIAEHNLKDFDDMFSDDSSRIHVITQDMLDCIVNARELHELTIGEKVPGWALANGFIVLPDGSYRFYTEEEVDIATKESNTDADLARLMWFEWWLKWALDNCERPAIYCY